VQRSTDTAATAADSLLGSGLTAGDVQSAAAVELQLSDKAAAACTAASAESAGECASDETASVAGEAEDETQGDSPFSIIVTHCTACISTD
jgi:hypothetical protein